MDPREIKSFDQFVTASRQLTPGVAQLESSGAIKGEVFQFMSIGGDPRLRDGIKGMNYRVELRTPDGKSLGFRYVPQEGISGPNQRAQVMARALNSIGAENTPSGGVARGLINKATALRGVARCFAGFAAISMLTSAMADYLELNNPEAVRTIATQVERGEMTIADLMGRPAMLAKVTAELESRNRKQPFGSPAFGVLVGMGRAT